MKELKRNPLDLNAIEFWASTCLYVFAVFILITQGNSGSDYHGQYYGYYPAMNGIAAFLSRLGRYTVLYIAFLSFNFRILPALVKQRNMPLYIVLAVIVLVMLGVGYAVTDTY